MQKDFHYYMTYALAKKAGIEDTTAKLIAWANQFTDDLTDCSLQGIQTQCSITGNYKDRQVQQTVLCAFHFIPGDKPNIHKWMVTRNSSRAKILVNTAIKLKSAISFGIALHTHQDTYSHEGFTGWNEKFNSCFSWDNLLGGLIENVGHADMRTLPDIVSAVWTDPRNDKQIINSEKFHIATEKTFESLCLFNKDKLNCLNKISSIMQQLNSFWKIKSYDERKKWLMKWAGITERYKYTKDDMWSIHKSEFISAARNQMAGFIAMAANL